LSTRQEREDMIAVSMLRDPLNVDLSRWTPLHTRLIKLAASYSEGERIDWFTRLRQAEMQPTPSKPSGSDLKLDDLPTGRTVLTLGGSPLVPNRALSDNPAGPPPPPFRFWSGFQSPSMADREGM